MKNKKKSLRLEKFEMLRIKNPNSIKGSGDEGGLTRPPKTTKACVRDIIK